MDETSDLYKALTDVLSLLAKNAYWYGEDTGDYSMSYVRDEDWFMQALETIGEIIDREGV